MASLVGLKDRFAVAFGNDPDADRHGIVTPSAGCSTRTTTSPSRSATCSTHRPVGGCGGRQDARLEQHDRPRRPAGTATRRSAGRIQVVRAGVARWLVCFGGEETPAQLLRKDGSAWTTDKDGPCSGLLAAEITARTGKDPGQHYQELTARSAHRAIRASMRRRRRKRRRSLKQPVARAVTRRQLAGEAITAKLSRAPGNGAPIGGLKVVTANGWFAARPSGTENVYKIYAESFCDARHLQTLVAEAQQIVSESLRSP